MASWKEEVEATLVDYFVVAGYDPDTGLVIDTSCETCTWGEDGLTPESRSRKPPLQRSFVAKVLHHFPQKRVGAPFSDEVLSLCMPKGLRFFTEKDVPLKATIHTFANIREDGSRINGTVITFYEEVHDSRICDAMSLLHTDHVRELTAREPSLDRERAHVPPGTVSGGTHTLPRGRRNRSKRISYYDGSGQNTLFMSKALCLITRLPLVFSTSTILRTLHEVLKSDSEPVLPLESYIYWILNEIPLPSPGTTLKVAMLNSTIVVQRPGLQELPMFDDSLGAMFQYVSVEKFLRLFACFLLEHQILLCSKEYSRLMCVSEAMCALAFPFRWQMVYVPILPYSQLKFVEAPVPYVMGWCYEESVPEFLFQSNVCVLDIDTGRLEFPEDLPSFPGAKQLCQEIKSAINRYSSHEDISPSTTYGTIRALNSTPVVVSSRITSSCRTDEWSAKRMSRSFDRDDVIDESISGSIPLSPCLSRADLIPLPLENVLKNNSAVARVTEIARRAGVVVDVRDLEQEISCSDQYVNSPDSKQYFQHARLNNAIRECVLNRIVCMLYSYEHFVIGGQGCSNRKAFDESRESLVCFDKASFLSDQPDSHLAFLAAFLETQMFTSLIDAKILSQWETPDENLILFDSRIATMREKLGLSMVRTPTYDSSPPFAYTEELISKREVMLDYVVSGPHELVGAVVMNYNGIWPEQMNTALLEGAVGHSPAPSPWKQRYPHLRPKQQEAASVGGRPASTHSSTGLVGDSSALIAQQQLKFVDQLLLETKGKTKRMLVDKMGREAVQLGHFDAGITGVEENTLVASFCDLLERIWAHGLIKKQGKSSLWNFVLQHQDLEKTCFSTRTMSSSMLTPGDARRCTVKRTPSLLCCDVAAPVVIQPMNENDFACALSEIVDTIQRELGKDDDENVPMWSRSILRAANFLADKLTSTSKGPQKVPAANFTPKGHIGPQSVLKKSCSVGDFSNASWNSEVRTNIEVVGSPRKRSQSRSRSPETGARVFLAPLPTHVAYDLKNVLRMTEIKTDIGFARAFVRLALERKLLHRHLATLLENNKLLRELYKPYAFVRCEDEREQFLYHILSLNAAQFRCFTNTFNKTKMDYQVVIVTGGWRGSLPPVWVTVGGSLCNSPQINLPPNTPLFKFDHKNLGVLSTLRIGHSLGPERPPKWYLDYVIVRNEITGQMYRFPCGRWLGPDVEDGRWFGNACDVSLERLLVAEPVCDDGNADFAFGTVSNSAAKGSRGRRVSSRSQTPQRERSPSQSRTYDSTPNRKTRITEIQQILGEAVNSLVKYFYSEKHSRSELAHLLCGEYGLVNAIEQAFQFGRHSSVWLFRQPAPWDYVEKVCSWFMDILRRRETKWSREQSELVTHALKLVHRISERTALAKDAKFHVFILLTIRDHMLSGFLQMMAWTPVTSQLYDELSFLRTPSHLTYLSKLLDSLNEFNFTFDSSLTYGIV